MGVSGRRGAELPRSFMLGFSTSTGAGTDGRRDARRAAEPRTGPDRWPCESRLVWGDPDQADQLARLGGFQHHLFAPAETRWFGISRFGNGLLSSLPVASWQRIPLPRRHGRSCRNMLLVELDFGSESVAVLVAHVTRSNDSERRIQLDSVLDLFASLDPPAILLADLNTAPGDPRIQRFRRIRLVDAITRVRIAEQIADWILARGLIACPRTGSSALRTTRFSPLGWLGRLRIRVLLTRPKGDRTGERASAGASRRSLATRG